MRSAPSVSYPVGRSRFGALVLGLGWAAGLVSLMCWWWLGPPAGWRHGGVALLWLACGALAWRTHRHMPGGQLHWDGAEWTLGEEPVAVQAVVDLQSVLLLRVAELDASSCADWYWVGQDADAQSWQPLRRAVYFRALEQAQPSGPVTP